MQSWNGRLALAVCVVATIGCEDVTAPEAAHIITELEDRIAHEWVGDPSGFPEGEALWTVAELARQGARSIPITITIDGREVEFRAVAYESANDPFVLTADGAQTVWRRGIIAWRGMPVEEVIGIWARAPGAVDRPFFRLNPSSEGDRIFARPSAFRVRRDTTFWNAVSGVVSVGDPLAMGPCRFGNGAQPAKRAKSWTPQITCTDATFSTSFDLVFERHDPAIDQALFQEMMTTNVDSLPFRGKASARISLPAVDIPGIRFVVPCGRKHGAPNDSTCVSTGARPSP